MNVFESGKFESMQYPDERFSYHRPKIKNISEADIQFLKDLGYSDKVISAILNKYTVDELKKMDAFSYINNTMYNVDKYLQLLEFGHHELAGILRDNNVVYPVTIAACRDLYFLEFDIEFLRKLITRFPNKPSMIVSLALLSDPKDAEYTCIQGYYAGRLFGLFRNVIRGWMSGRKYYRDIKEEMDYYRRYVYDARKSGEYYYRSRVREETFLYR